MRSIKKYVIDDKYRENVKVNSNKRYKMDKKYRMEVNILSIKRYRENEIFWEKKFLVVVKKYKLDDIFRLKIRVFSKDFYDFFVIIKIEKKERVKLKIC